MLLTSFMAFPSTNNCREDGEKQKAFHEEKLYQGHGACNG